MNEIKMYSLGELLKLELEELKNIDRQVWEYSKSVSIVVRLKEQELKMKLFRNRENV